MFVTNWISTTKIQKISEITNFFRHYFLSRTEVNIYILIIICEWGVVCIFGLLTVNLLTPIRKTTLSSPPS